MLHPRLPSLADNRGAQPEASGSHRRYRKASIIHGWVTKLRGTLTDNERVRSRGIREMREARAIRAYKKQKAAQFKGGAKGASGFLYLLSFWPAKRAQTQKQLVVRRHHSSHHRKGSSSHSSSRPSTHRRGTSSGTSGKSRRPDDVQAAQIGRHTSQGRRHSERQRHHGSSKR